MSTYDVVVIGGGPSGTASSIFLAERGYKVVLLDQARFPRDKVCGEFISPAADPILDQLGVLKKLESHSPMRLRGVYISAYEKESLWVDYPPMPVGPSVPTSLSVKRFLLDALMVESARDLGVQLLEEHRVDDLLFDGNSVVGVKGRVLDGGQFKVKCKIVVDAGGRNAVSLRRLNLKRSVSGAGRVALAAHWNVSDQVGDYCYMHVSRPGYTGIAKTSLNQANIVLVADPHDLRGKDRNEFYRETVLGNSLRADLLSGAKLMEPVRVVESLAYSVGEPSCDGMLLVGDAMGFIDPFTGEGIYLALRSAQIASEVIHSAMQDRDFSRKWLTKYGILRRREFGGKFILSRILQQLIYRPILCRAVVRILSSNPAFAKELAGVIGDYFPAGRLISASTLLKLLTKKFNVERRQAQMAEHDLNSLRR